MARPGPLSFLVLIDDLTLPCIVHKFVDGTTLSEALPVIPFGSNIASCVRELESSTTRNYMVVNTSKTKETFLEPLSKTNPQ